jgi:acyl-CoA thioesterase YciA
MALALRGPGDHHAPRIRPHSSAASELSPRGPLDPSFGNDFDASGFTKPAPRRARAVGGSADVPTKQLGCRDVYGTVTDMLIRAVAGSRWKTPPPRCGNDVPGLIPLSHVVLLCESHGQPASKPGFRLCLLDILLGGQAKTENPECSDPMSDAPSDPPVDKEPTLRVIPMPRDTNGAGDIFGGWIMSQVDLAGSVVAARRAQGRVVTVAINALDFKKPVYVGDLVSLYGEVVRVGKTSLTVDVQVYSQRGWRSGTSFGESVKVTEAVLTYVAVDGQGRPRAVSGK